VAADKPVEAAVGKLVRVADTLELVVGRLAEAGGLAAAKPGQAAERG